MASIQISELNLTGADLFSGSESFINDLTDNDFSGVAGGYFDPLDGDWCGTTRITKTITSLTTGPIGTIILNREHVLAVNQVLPM